MYDFIYAWIISTCNLKWKMCFRLLILLFLSRCLNMALFCCFFLLWLHLWVWIWFIMLHFIDVKYDSCNMGRGKWPSALYGSAYTAFISLPPPPSPPPGHFSNCIGSLSLPHITVSFTNIVPGDPCLTLLYACQSAEQQEGIQSWFLINLNTLPPSKVSHPCTTFLPQDPCCLCSQNRPKCNAAPSDLLSSFLSTTSAQIQYL